MIQAIALLTAAVRSNNLKSTASKSSELEEEANSALQNLSDAVLHNSDVLQSEIHSLLSAKDALETELSTLQLERSWLNKGKT